MLRVSCCAAALSAGLSVSSIAGSAAVSSASSASLPLHTDVDSSVYSVSAASASASAPTGTEVAAAGAEDGGEASVDWSALISSSVGGLLWVHDACLVYCCLAHLT